MKFSSRYFQAFLLPLVIFLTASPMTRAQQTSRAAARIHGINPANMDRSAVPGDNFYQYANGGWLARTEIPADRAEISVFSGLDDLANKRTADLIKQAAQSKASPGSDPRKVADFYNAFMDEKGIDAKGMSPLEPKLKAIASIQNKRELARALGESLRADVDPLNLGTFHTINLFGIWIGPGFQDSTHYHPYLLQGGLGLPSRGLYLGSDAHSKKVMAAYQTYLAAVLKMVGLTDADARATRVIALEHDIAEKHISLANSEDIHTANNQWSQADFAAKAPGLDWTEFFQGAGLSSVQKFYVWNPSAFTGEAALVASVPLDTWKDWLIAHAIVADASVLPKDAEEASFNMFFKTLYGVPQQRPRWQRGVFLTNDFLGDAVGQMYAKKYFSPAAKAAAESMVANIIAAYHVRLQGLTWMAPSTKKEALAKLDALYVGVGYPETWKSYAGYEVKPDDAIGNVERGRLFHYHQQISRLGKTVDRKEWAMEPQTVNAVNLPLQVGLNFPAAILQPPFFDPKAPAAANYGSIGAIIGHEISHTFDTGGSMFDAQGRLRDWWTPADLAHFKAATAKLAAQYDTYKPFPDLNLNGKQTLGENIADVAGLSAAYDGYCASLKKKAAPRQDGFTGDQQFFIAFGQSWGKKMRPAALRQQVLTDPHSPAEYRVDTVRNIDAWYKAFDVKPGQTLYLAPADRVRIW